MHGDRTLRSGIFQDPNLPISWHPDAQNYVIYLERTVLCSRGRTTEYERAKLVEHFIKRVDYRVFEDPFALAAVGSQLARNGSLRSTCMFLKWDGCHKHCCDR